MYHEHMTNPKYLFFDTETTDVQSKDIIQLAIITQDNTVLNKYFKPIQKIEFAAMAVHHITPEMLEDKELFEDSTVSKNEVDSMFNGKTLKEYLNFLAENYIWVAHNAEFDLEVLAKKGITVPKYICTYKLARNMLTDIDGKSDLESYALQFLRYYLGLYKLEDNEHITAHDALSDVYFLRNLFEYIQKNSSFTAEQMMQITKEPAIMRNMHFGKYAGRTLEDIAKLDREYLQWVEESMTDKPDLVWNVKRVLDMHEIGGGLFGQNWV